MNFIYETDIGKNLIKIKDENIKKLQQELFNIKHDNIESIKDVNIQVDNIVNITVVLNVSIDTDDLFILDEYNLDDKNFVDKLKNDIVNEFVDQYMGDIHGIVDNIVQKYEDFEYYEDFRYYEDVLD